MAQIDIEQLDKLIAEADKIFLTPEAENTLVRLLEIEQQVELAIKAAKDRLEKAGLARNPNFNSIQGDRVKVYYRAFGARYYIDEAQIDLAPKELYTKETTVKYTIDSKAVEKWVDEHKGMPTGISEVERKKSISISLKDKDRTTTADKLEVAKNKTYK